MPKRILFLSSGGGGNLRAVHLALQRGLLDGFTLVGVLADRSCGALDYARKSGLVAEEIAYSRQSPEALTRALSAAAPDIVVTTFHKIIDPSLVRAYAGRMVNLHYSLLPSYAATIGQTPVRAAFDAGNTLFGATAHYVDEGVDTGRIICQTALPRQTEFDATMNLVFRAGILTLLNAFAIVSRRASEARTPVVGPDTFFMSPAPLLDFAPFDATYWDAVRGS